MIADKMKADFDRDGFFVFENALNAEQSAALADAIDAKCASSEPCNRGPGRQSYQEHNVDCHQGTVVPEVYNAYGLPHVMAATTALAGEDWHFHLDANIFSTPPHGGKQGWHQDTAEMGPGIYFVNRIFFPRTITREMGPLILVPGSHKMGDLPPGGQHDDIEGQIEIIPKAGSLVFMCSRVWHRVGLNQSDRPRRNCIFRVRPWAAPHNLEGGVTRKGRTPKIELLEKMEEKMELA